MSVKSSMWRDAHSNSTANALIHHTPETRKHNALLAVFIWIKHCICHVITAELQCTHTNADTHTDTIPNISKNDKIQKTFPVFRCLDMSSKLIIITVRTLYIVIKYTYAYLHNTGVNSVSITAQTGLNVEELFISV